MLDAPASTVTMEQTPPAIGSEWQGGTYIGHTLHENQLAHLVVLPEDIEVNWADANAMAAKQDGVLPSRIDLLVMLPHRDALGMKKDWYWSAETHPADAAYAWCQGFGDGDQDFNHKHIYTRARAVRRIVIK